jgi:N6-adenosine-specific RNA methylase IME4
MKIDRDLLRRLPLALRIEVEENLQRKDFLPSELAAVWRSIEAHERTAAKTRQGARTDQHGGKLSTKFGKARDKIGAAAGVSGRTLQKIVAVVAAAEAEPERFGKLKADMDRTGVVNGVYRRLKIAKQAELIRAEPPPLPGNGPYRVLVIDPPWLFDETDEDSSQRGIGPYPRMTIDEICALPVASIAASDSILWLWCTNFHLSRGAATTVVHAWGFEPRSILTWAKDRMGNGRWLRGQTEHCIVAVRGKPIVTLTNQTTLLHAPVRGHSQKPAEFYDLVESLCPAPRYAELFSRYQHNDRWDLHGDEAPTTEAAQCVPPSPSNRRPS